MKAQIISVFGRFYTVRCDHNDVLCVLPGKMRRDRRWERYSNPVAVGDYVEVELQADGSGLILEVLERRNVFSRKEKARSRREDIIAANLDLVLVIQSFVDPMINPRFVDRLAVRAAYHGIPLALCVNKCDLVDDEDFEIIHDYYEGSGLPVIFTSIVSSLGIEDLRTVIAGRTVLLAGFSGVGKSSLVNALYPELELDTTEVSIATGKGRHTTTNVRMHCRNDGTGLIDTPGVREFGLMDIETNELAGFFYEFGSVAGKCQFSPCFHDHEPGCMLKDMVEEGDISADRYQSYLNILYSLQDQYARMYR